MPNTGIVREGVQIHHESDEIAYVITTTNQTSSPTLPVVVEIIDLQTQRDVKATVMPSGSPTVSSNDITLPIIKLLRADHKYNVWVKWTDGSEIKEVMLPLDCPARDRRR